jgi:hypothetical protein
MSPTLSADLGPPERAGRDSCFRLAIPDAHPAPGPGARRGRRPDLPVRVPLPGRRLTRIFDDPQEVAGYPEKESFHLWDQHRFDVLDLDAEAAR